MVNWNSFSFLEIWQLRAIFFKTKPLYESLGIFFLVSAQKGKTFLYTYAYNQNDETLPNLSKG
jgi:hypothetical protein